MRNRMYGGVRGRKTKVGEKLLRFPPTRFIKLEEFDLFCFSSVLSCIIAEKIWCLRVFIVLLYAVKQVHLYGVTCTTRGLYFPNSMTHTERCKRMHRTK